MAISCSEIIMYVDQTHISRPGGTALLPTVAWEFSPLTPSLHTDGMMVGAALHHGRGRVVVFSEAAMLTAQLAGPQRMPVGMNAPEATHHSRDQWCSAPYHLAAGTPPG